MSRAPRRRRRQPAPTPRQRAQARRSLGFNPAATGVQAEQRKAAQRSQRARQRIPAPAVPHVPVIRNPSPRQIQAAHTTIARAVNRHVRGRTPQQRNASRRQVVAQIERDPRLQQFRDAAHHYAKAEERLNARRVGRQALRGQTVAQPIYESTPSGATRVVGYRRVPLASVVSKGDLARAGRRVSAYQVRRDRAGAAPPDRRVGVGPASFSVPGLQRAIAAGTSLDVGDIGPRHFFANSARDVGALATGPFVGAWELSQAVQEAQRTVPGLRSLVDAANRTPILGRVIADGSGTARLEHLARGAAQGVAETFAHPIRSFEEHPILTPLTVAGGVGAVGRVGGALARGAGTTAEAAGVRGALARVGSTVRPPEALSSDAAAVALKERRYSKDLFRKAFQVAADRDREVLRRADGTPVTGVRQGREVPVLAPKARNIEKEGRRQANFEAQRNRDEELVIRQEVASAMRLGTPGMTALHNAMRRSAGRVADRMGLRGQASRDLVAMVAEGTVTSVRHFESDLRSYRDMVRGEIRAHEERGGVYKSRKQLRDAKATVQRIDRYLSDKRVAAQKEKIVALGEQMGRALNVGDREAARAGILDETRARRARLIHPAVLHAGARHYTPEELAAAGVDVSRQALEHGALRAPDGRFISNADIEDVLRSKGRDPDTVAYLPPGALGRRAFHARFNLSRPNITGGATRTGEQFRRGLTSANAESLVEQGTRLATQVQKARNLDRVVSSHGMRHPSGRDFTGREAKEFAKRLLDDAEGVEDLVPVRRVPAKATQEMNELARAGQSPSAMETLNRRLLDDRLKVDDNTQNVVLMPRSFVEQLQRHAAPTPDIVKPFQMLNRAFRYAVLPQPRWLTGNAVEPFLVRLPTVGSGVNVFGLAMDLRAASKALRAGERHASPEVRAASKAMRAQISQGLFVGSRNATVRRTLEEMPGNRAFGRAISRLPAVEHTLAMARMFLHGAMAPIRLFLDTNRVIENVANRAAFGHSVRQDVRQFTGSWAKTVWLGEKAAREAAEGLVNTSTQRRYLDDLHELLGKYSGFGPTMRGLTQTIFPFVPWMLNAARFVFWTMPAHNTTKTAFLMAVNDTVQKDWQQLHGDTPPGSLRFAIPDGKGGWIDLARYTPYGAFTEAAGGGGFRTFTSQVLPQIAGVQAAAEGRDPFGSDLKVPPTAENPKGTPSGAQQALIAVNQALESTVPYLSTARRLREHGATAYANSTVLKPQTKPGTSHGSALERTFDPLRPVYLRSQSSAPTAPASHRQRLLERAAERSATGGLSQRQMDLLERAARRAAGG